MNETSYRIAFSMYVALGGDPNATFESVDAVYDEIHKLLGVGGAENVETLKVNITRPGEYNYTPYNGIGYNPVLINVDIDATKFEFDFSEAGYDTKYNNAVNNFIYENTLNDIEISKNFMNEVNELMEDESKITDNYFGSIKSRYIHTLAYAPMLNYTKIYKYGITDIFHLLERLIYIPKIDTSTWTTMEGLFLGCYSLPTISQLDTSKVTNMSNMFEYCHSLTTIPLIDTSKVTDMSYMFRGCDSLTSIPQLDTSKVTNMSNMFGYCTKLTSIPQLDTSKVTNMSYMFYDCSSLTTIPQLDTSKVTNMSNMFYSCSFTTIPQLDTSKVEIIDGMFAYCDKLITLPMLDFSNVRSLSEAFRGSSYDLTNINGFKNLGMNPSMTDNLDLSWKSKLTYESVMNVINNLYDRANAGMSVLTVMLSHTTLPLLSDDDIAIATNKGWIIS